MPSGGTDRVGKTGSPADSAAPPRRIRGTCGVGGISGRTGRTRGVGRFETGVCFRSVAVFCRPVTCPDTAGKTKRPAPQRAGRVCLSAVCGRFSQSVFSAAGTVGAQSLGHENPVADRDAELVGIPLRRAVERIGVLRLHRTVGIHVYLAVETVSVVVAVHPCPSEEGVEQPPLPELVFVTHAQADHHAVAFAVAVFEFQLPAFDIGFRHVESHHADIGAQIPAPVVLLEVAAVFAHEDGEGHMLPVDRLPRRDHDVGLQGRFGGYGEFHRGVYDADQRIERVEFDVALRCCVLYAEQRKQYDQDRNLAEWLFHRDGMFRRGKYMKKSGQYTNRAGFSCG